MKSLAKSNSMSSSSSSTSTSFNEDNFFSSRTATATSCLAGIFRRIICPRSLPTHPSDHFHELNSSTMLSEKDHELFSESESTKEKVDKEKIITPGVVARLMGLDSLPNTITRSRSMNSLDCKEESGSFDSNHGRVKYSTASFREITPTFVELENEEFLEFRFENGSEIEEKRSKGRKREVGFGELKKKKDKKLEKITEKKKGGNSANVEKSKFEEIKVGFGLEIMESSRSIKQIRDQVSLCNSEESSPVSVLDFDQFMIHHDFPTSELQTSSRRKLSPKSDHQDHRSRQQRQHTDNSLKILGDECTKKFKQVKCFPCVNGSMKKDWDSEECLLMWDRVFEMSEAEISESNWFSRRRNMDDLEDMCEDFESRILDQILDGLVYQLIGLP